MDKLEHKTNTAKKIKGDKNNQIVDKTESSQRE
jgi:hypothetical protein